MRGDDKIVPAEPQIEIEVVEAEVVDAPARTGSGDTDERIKEIVELSLYLADQIEGFDRVIAGMGDLPNKLEGVVSQALRRTLTARAKLDSEAEAALDDALAALDEHVDTMSDGRRTRSLTTRRRSASSADGQVGPRRQARVLRDQVARSNEAIATALDALGQASTRARRSARRRRTRGKPAKSAATKKTATQSESESGAETGAEAKPRSGARRIRGASRPAPDQPTGD